MTRERTNEIRHLAHYSVYASRANDTIGETKEADMKRQAKMITDSQMVVLLDHLADSPRDTAMFLLSVKAGLRAVEISRLRWRMVIGSDGEVANEMDLEDIASKGGYGGRRIPINGQLRAALRSLLLAGSGGPDAPVIGLARGTIVNWFFGLYRDFRMVGCSSHSGRRTFITKAARACSAAGGSLRDVQEMAGHASLGMTQNYIQGCEEAKRRIVDGM